MSITRSRRRLFGGITAFEFGNCAATLLILRATELFDGRSDTDTATTTALVLYVGYNVAATVTSLVAGRATDRSGPVRVLAAGVAAFAVAYAGFTIDATNPLTLIPWFVLAGIGIGYVETAEHAARSGFWPGCKAWATWRRAASPGSSGPPLVPNGRSATSPAG